MSDYVKELQMHIRDREYKIEKLKQENQKLKEALEVASEALEFAASEDMWESDGEYIESFSYQYKEWYQDKLDQALSKLRDLGIVKEGE